jgi:polysaccharide chain length determinant protein (PEP-CTERM system associated)
MRPDQFTPSGDESFLRRTIEILTRRRAVAAVTFAAVIAAALSFARYLPDLYRSSAIVLVERQLPETFVRPVVSDELESRLHVIKQEILSRARLTELVERFDLYPTLRARGDMDAVLDQMRHDIDVEPTGPEQVSGRTKTVAFNLTYIGDSAETAADVTNAIAAFYVAQNNQMRAEEAARTKQFLKAQLDDARKQLSAEEQAVRAYTNRHVGELPQQVEVNLATLERLNTQLRLNGERQLRTLEQREKLIQSQPVPSPGMPMTTAPPSEAAQRLEQLKQDLKAQLTKGTEAHPDVRRLRDEIEAVEQQVRAEAAAARARAAAAAAATTPSRPSARTLQSLDGELDALKEDEARLRASIAGFERRLEAVPYRQNEFALISRDHQAAKDLYDSLLKRYEEAELAASMEAENQGERFRILESAIAPLGPSAPNRPRLLVMGLLLAVLLTGLVVLAVEQLDTSFHSVADVRAFTNVPVLVTIPRIGPVPSGVRLRTAIAATSVAVLLAGIVALSAYLAHDNDQIVRLLVRSV